MQDAEERLPPLVALGGAGLALASLPLASAAGPPYLSLASVNPWIVVFAVGVFVLLFTGPFVIERRLRPTVADRDSRWERALLIWGGICAGILLAGVLIGGATGFSGDSLAGTTGLLVTIAAGLVEGTLIAWLLAG